jgi:hypothetical protein
MGAAVGYATVALGLLSNPLSIPPEYVAYYAMIVFFAIAVMSHRVLLGCHTALQVFVGACIGILSGGAGALLYNRAFALQAAPVVAAALILSPLFVLHSIDVIIDISNLSALNRGGSARSKFNVAVYVVMVLIYISTFPVWVYSMTNKGKKVFSVS